MWFRGTSYTYIIVPLICSFNFSFQLSIKCRDCLSCTSVQFLCSFHHPDMVISMDVMSKYLPFIFKVLGYPFHSGRTSSLSKCNTHKALQELKAVVLILHRIAFCLFLKMTALHLDISTAEACLCNQCHTVYLFLSRLVCCILNLARRHGTTHVQAYILTHLNVEDNYLLQGRLVQECYLPSCVAQVMFQLSSQLELDLLTSPFTDQCQHYYTLGNPLPLGAALGFNTFNHPWIYQVCCTLPPSVLVSLVLSISLVEYVTGQFKLLILVASCWMEAPWPTTVLNMLENVICQHFLIKDLISDAFLGWLPKGCLSPLH